LNWESLESPIGGRGAISAKLIEIAESIGISERSAYVHVGALIEGGQLATNVASHLATSGQGIEGNATTGALN
jgi:hypothetical protein